MLLSARANSARIHITEHVPENPKRPPMLCMLLRKELGGAKLTGVHQTELERAVALQFESLQRIGRFGSLHAGNGNHGETQQRH